MAGPGNDEERLPWLAPYRETAAKPPSPASPRKRGAAKIIGGVAALAAAVTAGYYVGQRGAAPPAAPTATAPVAAPTPMVAAPDLTAAPPAEVESAPVAVEVAAPAPTTPAKRAAAKRRIRSAGIESARIRAVRAAQEARAAPRPAARAWPRMPSPGPAGQVIQLGAFKNPARANAAYRMRLARYPVLGSMPRVVVPVVTKPRGQILYVLRLGTSSRQQSAIVCRNLRASGDHCLVIG